MIEAMIAGVRLSRPPDSTEADPSELLLSEAKQSKASGRDFVASLLAMTATARGALPQTLILTPR
jgi:hypothetical protein